jgi:hypothetical protein
MDPTPFELTPEQKGMLASLSRETGKPVATLLAAIAAALEELEENERLDLRANGELAVIVPPPQRKKSFGEIATELLADVPEEVFDQLPTDGSLDPIFIDQVVSKMAELGRVNHAVNSV